MTSVEESERRFRLAPWSTQQIAGAFGLLIVAGGSGYGLVAQRSHDKDDSREMGELVARMTGLEQRMTTLEHEGSPVVRALEALLKADEARIVTLETVVRANTEARLADLRNGVSQVAVDDLKHRIEDSNAQSLMRDNDLRASIESMTRAILGQGNRALVGPR